MNLTNYNCRSIIHHLSDWWGNIGKTYRETSTINYVIHQLNVAKEQKFWILKKSHRMWLIVKSRTGGAPILTHTTTHAHTHSVQPVGMWLSTDVFRTSSGCSFPRIPSVEERAHSASKIVRSIEKAFLLNHKQQTSNVVFRSSHATTLLVSRELKPDTWQVRLANGGKAMAEIPLERNLSAERLTCAGGMLGLDWTDTPVLSIANVAGGREGWRSGWVGGWVDGEEGER